MKNTFRYLAAFVVAVMAVALWSCSDDDKDEPINAANLPENAQTFIGTHYSGVSIVSVTRDKDDHQDEYDVRLSNGHEVTFNAAGEWTDVDAPANQSVPDGLVPESIALYITTNYAGAGINEISKSAAGYEIELTNGVDLDFDSMGNFLRVDK
ncbi:MAG: PepSY-like domain-containing protein [Muribaculaceae bacterium]|nr:PepSY-like domain-containing protein [Muribaculaceae bacterium]